MVRTIEKFHVTREVGRHYGKYDLDRVGFFDDAPPGPFDKYVKKTSLTNNDSRGRQLLGGRGNDFFDKKFKRIFDGEAPQTSQIKKKVDVGGRSRVLLPPSPAKLHSTPNDWFGCIGKPPDYFSPELRKSKDTKRKSETGGVAVPNFKIKPNPIGGPGYVDICLNPYPKHLSEPYDGEGKKKGGKVKAFRSSNDGKFLTASAPRDYFPPNPYVDPKPGPTYVRPANKTLKNSPGAATFPFYVPFPKRPGGQHAGCFNKFLGSPNDPYRDKIKNERITGPKFVAGGPNVRSKYTTSIINQVTAVSCNVNNFRDYRERVYPRPR